MLTFSPEGTAVGTDTTEDTNGKRVDIGTGTGKEDDVDGSTTGQVPKAGWQPVPQWAASEPQYPYREQQSPNVDP